MSLVLLNLQSNQQIKLDNQHPLIIGRGNVDGCYDKRVSRNHGRITCTLDGKIRLVALHCNPCFFTRNGVPPVLQLNKDEEETLSEGDCLGLLPNAFWFQVTSSKKSKIKSEPEDFNCIEIDISDDKRSVKNELAQNGFQANDTVISENVKCMPSLSTDSSNSLPVSCTETDTVSNSASTSKGYGTPEFEKTRRLPLWMYEIDESVESDKTSNKNLVASIQQPQNKRQKVTSSNIMSLEIKKEPDAKSESRTYMKEDTGDTTEASTSKVENFHESDLSSHQTGSVSSTQAQGESSKVTSQKEGYESDVNIEVDNIPKRPICQYEDKCYRKNPQHKLDYCHPGDADYTPYEERPVCQYGAACYRRNEKHRVEFRHSLPGSDSRHTASPSSHSPTSLASSPLPEKRRRKKVKNQNSDYKDDDDEYDLEDPFLNDASSDEYVPSDWDSEEEDLEDFDASQEDER